MKRWSTYIFAALLCAGCTEEVRKPDPPAPPLSADKGEVVLTIQFPHTGPGTYAIDDTKENKISRLDILSFTKSLTGDLLTDTLKYHVSVPGNEITDVDANGRTKTVKVTLNNMPQDQRLVLIANLPAYSPDIVFSDLTGATMSAIIDKLRFGASTWRLPVAKTDTTSFPMFGQMNNFVTITNTSHPSSLTFNMIRAVAKIDVGVDIYGTGDPALGFGHIFEIQNVYVYNASDSGYIAPHNEWLTTKNLNGVDTVIQKVNLVGDYRETNAYPFPPNGNRLGNMVYLPESDTLNTSTGYTPAYLVVGAKYMGGAEKFYRIDFTDNGKYVPILRNHNYVINITGIRTEGYATKEAAAAAPVSRHGSLILDQADESGLKEIISYNNDYYLAVSSTNLNIDWMAKEVTVHLKTSFPDGWKASDPTGFSSFSVRDQHTSYRQTVLDSVRFLVVDNLTGQPKKYTFNIKSGMLTQKITVTQSAGSNSYIVKRGGSSIDIPITSADADGVNRSAACVTIDKVDLENIMTSFNIDVTDLPNKYFKVIAPSAPSGANGIVVMKDAAGKILYSWHIWVTSYDPEDVTTQKANNGFIFMDRNLGAASSTADGGLYYQWGRKDPFVSSPFIGIDTIESIMSLEVAIQHPDTFYAVPLAAPFDWIGTSQNNNLWNTVDGEKGPYDPCPFGWRVPVAKSSNASDWPWYGFSNNSRNGTTYPLAGYLDAFSGAKNDATTAGGVWSASPAGQQAYLFKFTGSSATQAEAYRANAYPVRCVKDIR